MTDLQEGLPPVVRRLQAARRVLSAAVVCVFAIWVLVLPAVEVVRIATESALGTGVAPAAVFRWHANLARRYERWVPARLAAAGAGASDERIEATEWPLFGAVFFLLAAEELQRACLERSLPCPAAVSRAGLDAAAALVADPRSGEWVRRKWGPDYRHRENVFYREMLILGLGAYERTTGDRRHRALLHDQVTTLGDDLMRSPHVLVDDFPGECYPADDLWAIAGMLRTDPLLGTNHRALAERARAAYVQLEDRYGLPPYFADSRTGESYGARGNSTSAFIVMTPDLDPALARRWYDRYREHFFQRAALMDGFREFARDTGIEWGLDVDAGPIVFGHGVAATAFGAGAALAIGRADDARTLAAQVVALSWPMPHGRLLAPGLLSDAVGAPLLGDSAVLFILTRRPAETPAPSPAHALSPMVWLVPAAALLLGGLFFVAAARAWRRAPAAPAPARVRRALVAWAALLAAAAAALLLSGWLAVALLLIASDVPERIVRAG